MKGGESRIPVVVVGLGEIGRAAAAAALRHPELELVGAVDAGKQGRPLDELVAGARGMKVETSSREAYRRARDGVAIVCTGSTLDSVREEIERALRSGLHVVSCCEELANPFVADPELAERLDAQARKAGRAVLGTGVNPGFVFDRLIATLGGVVGDVQRVEARRVVDLRHRRRGLLRRFGVGLRPKAFDDEAEAGELGHIGLSESCALLAEGLGLDLDEVEETIDAILATTPVEGEDLRIAEGEVVGARQVAQGFSDGKEVVRLELECVFAAEEESDWIRVAADPPIELRIPNGIPGDRATAWALVHAVPRVAAAEAGLLTVLDLPAGR